MPNDPHDLPPGADGAGPDPEHPPSEEDAASAAAANRAVGGGNGSGRTTRRIKELVQETVESAKTQKDKTVIVVGILGLAVFIGLAAFVLLNKRQPSQPQVVNYTPQFDASMSSEEEIRGFTSKTAKEVTDIKSEVTELTKSMEGLIKRQDDTETFVRDTMKKATDEFEKQGEQKVKMMEAYAKSQEPQDPRTASIIDQFRESLTNLKESPAEAKARAALMLKQAGVSEDQIRNLLADAAEQAGRISVGDIAEAPLTSAEVAQLPDWVHDLIPAVRDAIYGFAITEGRFYPDQVWTDVKVFLRARVRDRNQVTDALAKQVAQIARVRRENLPSELQDVLPYLITLRDSQHVNHEDRAGIARLVWSVKDRYPGTTTAGQMLALCDVVARAIGATAPASSPAAGFLAIDAKGIAFATEVVTNASAEAVQLGKTQADLYVVADRALSNYLDTTRATATADQRREIILNAMNEAIRRKAAVGSPGAAAPAAPAAAAAPASGTTPAAAVDTGENELFFGPIRLTRGLVQRAVVYCLPSLMTVNGMEVQGAPGASALICGIEQVPRIVSAELTPYLGKPMGGREFLQTVLPEVISAMHLGQALGSIPIPVSPGKANEDSWAARLVRGAEIGAIYGPLVHDEAKAKAVAPDALTAVEAAPPLTPAAVERLSHCSSEQPYAAIITALDIVRPGQFGYPANRFQEIADSMQQLVAYAREEKDQVAGLFTEGQEGVYEENVRMLIPLSLAEHDESITPMADVCNLVRADINAYTVLFLAEGRVSKQVMDEVIPRYAPAVSEESGGGSALVQYAVEAVPSVIDEIYAAKSREITPDRIADVVSSLTAEATPLVEERIVEQVVLSRVLPRVEHSASLSDQETELQAMAHAKDRTHALVAPPYTPARIDNWASQITDECRAIIAGTASGKAGAATAPAGNRAAGPGGHASGYWPAVTMLPVSGGAGNLVGTSTTLVATRQIILPANTYGNAHIQTGVDAEVGGRANLPVMMQIDFDWNGPADSRVVMRGCRISGVANALAGPERVAIDLKTLSYVFPSGREIDAEVHGYVSDNINGEYGALGIYKWNADKVLPLATIAGGFKGAADALKANSTTTIVGAAGTTAVTANQGAAFKTAAFGGVAGGFGIMSDYVDSVLQAVHPSVSVVNGQRLSVVLLEPVVLNVPEEEFDALMRASPGQLQPVSGWLVRTGGLLRSQLMWVGFTLLDALKTRDAASTVRWQSDLL